MNLPSGYWDRMALRCSIHLSELSPIKVPFPSLSSKFSDSTTATAIRVLFCLFFHFHTYNSCRFPLKSFEYRHWCNPSLYRKSSNLAWIRSPTEIRIWFYVFHLNTNSLIKGVLIACNPMPSLSLDVDLCIDWYSSYKCPSGSIVCVCNNAWLRFPWGYIRRIRAIISNKNYPTNLSTNPESSPLFGWKLPKLLDAIDSEI